MNLRQEFKMVKQVLIEQWTFNIDFLKRKPIERLYDLSLYTLSPPFFCILLNIPSF